MWEIWGDVAPSPRAMRPPPLPPLQTPAKVGPSVLLPALVRMPVFLLLGSEQAPRRRSRRGREVTRRRDEEGRLGRGRRQEAGGRGRQGGRGQGQGASQGGGLAAGQGRQAALTCASGRRDGPRLSLSRARSHGCMCMRSMCGGRLACVVCALQASHQARSTLHIFHLPRSYVHKSHSQLTSTLRAQGQGKRRNIILIVHTPAHTALN